MTFRNLHRPGAPFVMPNAWDVGSARILAGLGAQAVATTSAGFAQTLGRVDMGHVSRDEMLTHCADLAASVNVPVSGDLENGYGPNPEDCAETVRLAAEAGLAGLCLEDVDANAHAYPYDLAVERMHAAASAARALPQDMVLFARADGVMHGAYDLDEALKRVHGFTQVGVDGIYVPMPGRDRADLDALDAICRATTLPVNVLVAGPWTSISRAALAKTGVARISLGSSLARKVMSTLIEVGGSALSGDFSSLSGSTPFDEQDRLLAEGAS